MVESTELLLDPLNDRPVKSVPKPPRHPLSSDRLFCKSNCLNQRFLEDGKPDIVYLRKFLSDSGVISRECIVVILQEITSLFSKCYIFLG